MELKVVVHKEKQMWKISSCWMELTHYTNYLDLQTAQGLAKSVLCIKCSVQSSHTNRC
jgi:hypothetical protein